MFANVRVVSASVLNESRDERRARLVSQVANRITAQESVELALVMSISREMPDDRHGMVWNAKWIASLEAHEITLGPIRGHRYIYYVADEELDRACLSPRKYAEAVDRWAAEISAGIEIHESSESPTSHFYINRLGVDGESEAIESIKRDISSG